MSVEVKAGRLVDEGRVSITHRDRYVTMATVTGDTGTWKVTRSVDGFEGCSCPAVARCAHLVAVEMVTRTGEDETMEATDAPESAGTDVEVLEDTEPGYDPTPPTEPVQSNGDVGDVDPETGEIVENAEVARHAVDSTLVAVAEAPITARTLEYISRTEFVPANLRGKPPAVLACVLYGRSMGLDPMQALAHVNVIDGRPAPSAELLLRMIRGAGHQVEVLEATDTAVRLRGTRTDDDQTLEVEFTIEDAARAGLVTIDDGTPRARSRNGAALPWELYPSDLLWARAVSRLHRRLFPDVREVTP